jgi:hypothetical protein
VEIPRDQIEGLVGGGRCESHYHEFNPTRDNLIALEQLRNIRRVSAAYTATERDDIIVVDTSVASVTVTLPVPRNGKEFVVSKAAAVNSCVVAFSGSHTAYGQTSITTTALGAVTRLKAFNGNWITI